MQIDVTNGKRFTEYDALAAVASGEDVLLVRLADGTGVKRIPISAIRAFINGDLDTLETEDKTSLIAAINEVFGLVGTNAQDIKALKELTTMLGRTGASRANSFIYEHDLGASFTAEQSADIRAGKFEKVRTGGYWTINSHKYWAAHADYRLHCGDIELTTHHMLVIPDKSFYNGVMNDTNVTTGSYYGSKNGYDTGIDKSQLALFQARPDLITNRENWWLRGVRSATLFCIVNYNGCADSWYASNSFGVRPAFLIY